MLIIVVTLLYIAGSIANDFLFSSLELHRGAHWVYLPAGFRMLSVLLLGTKGAIGIFLGSFLVVSFLGKSDLLGYFVEPMISACAPLIVYYLALRYGLSASLKNLNAKILTYLSAGCATSNATLHSMWYSARGVTESFIDSFIAMFVGDLLGTLIVIYAMQAYLRLSDARRK